MAGINYLVCGKTRLVRRTSETMLVSAEKISVDPKYEDRLTLGLGNDRVIYAFLDMSQKFATYNEEPFPDKETAEKEFEKVESAVRKGNYQLEFNPCSGYKLKLKPANRRRK